MAANQVNLRDFVYLSQRKVDQMYAQLTAKSGVREFEVKGEATIGLAKAGVSFKGREPTDTIQKLAEVERHLKAASQIGTIENGAKYFEVKFTAHCVSIGQVFFFGELSIQGAPRQVLLGLACSREYMIGGGGEGGEGLHELGTPQGKAKVYGVKWTSSNVGFASELASIPSLEIRVDELLELRNQWTEKYRPSEADQRALDRKRFTNRFIEFFHLRRSPASPSFWNFRSAKPWPPREPEPKLEVRTYNAPLHWLLGHDLYDAKVAAINRSWQHQEALKSTEVDPLQIEVLRGVRRRVHDRRPPVQLSYRPEEMLRQTYTCLAVRVAERVIDEELVVLASPVYVAL
jgi:hypothetical protein